MAPSFGTRPTQPRAQPTRRSRRTPALSPRSSAARDTANVIDTCYDSSGQRLVTVQDDGTLTLWRATGTNEWDVEATFQTRHGAGAVRVVRFAPPRLSPAVVATVGSDGSAVVYRLFAEAEARLEGAVVANETVLLDASRALTDVAFSGDGTLATLGEERVLRLYRTPDNGDRWGLSAVVDVAHGVDGAGGVSFAPGGEFCVAGGDIVARGMVEFEWVVRASVAKAEGGGGKGNAVLCADWAASGFLGVARADGAVEVWEYCEGRLNRLERMFCDGEMEGTKVMKIEWDRSGAVLATAHDDKVLRTWARMPDGENGAWVWALRDKFTLESSE